jgi:hypothetical protein
MSFDMRINCVKILLRKADPGKCVLRVLRIDRSASISWRIIRLRKRNLKLYQQVHCRGLFIIFGHDTRHSTIYHHVSSMNLSFTTMYHRLSNGWTMVRSTNDLELLPRTPTSAQRVSVCWKRQKTAKRFDQTLRLPSLSVIFLVEGTQHIDGNCDFHSLRQYRVIDNESLEWYRLINWWTVALSRRYELRHANQLCQNFVAEGRPW